MSCRFPQNRLMVIVNFVRANKCCGCECKFDGTPSFQLKGKKIVRNTCELLCFKIEMKENK